uniref:Uncharacterized protein n=1 Tax=Anguilla anguilla TaxID=7936 RepID=A0A0E9S6N2_ANGAN
MTTYVNNGDVYLNEENVIIYFIKIVQFSLTVFL